LGDVPRDLYDRKRGFSYVFEKNGELSVIKKVTELSDADSVVFDVGANIGEYSQTFLDLNYLGSLHLFEIDSELNKSLAAKFAESPNVILNEFGLSNTKEVRDFNRFINYTGANSLFPIVHRHLETARTFAELNIGDEYCAQLNLKKILFMKLDVEGWERFVLEGLQKKLVKKEIEIISWEYGYVSAEAGWTTKDFYGFFESMGYICGVIRAHGVDFRDWDYSLNDWKSGPNFLACLPKYKVEFESFS
jgi:FkbM family methyltransferase